MKNTNYKDQVFICFRGKDVRYKFLPDLKTKLIDGNFNVFTDDDLTGQTLQSIFEYIRNSKVVIVIISENYAESEWCLKELAEIKKCYETEKVRAVIPIFHNVRVTNVKEQSEEFGKKFLALQNSLLAKEVDKEKIDCTKFKIEEWKNALKMIGGIAGVSYDKTEPEPDFLERVLKKNKQQGNQFHQIIFNVNQLNVNILHRRSRTLDGPILSWNPEGYNESIDVKPSSGAIKRSASYLDNKDQLGPFPFEAIRVQKEVVPDNPNCLCLCFTVSALVVSYQQSKTDDPEVMKK